MRERDARRARARFLRASRPAFVAAENSLRRSVNLDGGHAADRSLRTFETPWLTETPEHSRRARLLRRGREPRVSRCRPGISCGADVPAVQAGAPMRFSALTCIRPLGYGESRAAGEGRAEAMAPRSSLELWALFLWSERKEAADVGARRQALLERTAVSAARRPRGARVGRARRAPRWSTSSSATCSARGSTCRCRCAAFDEDGVRGRPRLRRLLDPRLAGHLRVGHAADPRCRLGDPRPVHRGADALAALRDRRPDHARAVRADPRPIAASAEEYLAPTGIADTCYFGPECEFFVFDEVCYDLDAERVALLGRLERGLLELGQARASATRPARRTATSRGRRTTRCTTCGREMVLTLERLGIPCEFHHHEVATGGQCEIDLRFQSLTRMADQIMTYKYVVKNVARRARQDGDVHAEADLRRQRLGHALPPVALEGGQAAVGGQVRLRRALAAGPRLRRRPAQARAGAARVLRADDELVPPARPGLRGAGQPRLLAAQPLGLHPDPDVLRLAEGEADRVPLPRPDRRTRTSPSRRC